MKRKSTLRGFSGFVFDLECGHVGPLSFVSWFLEKKRQNQQSLAYIPKTKKRNYISALQRKHKTIESSWLESEEPLGIIETWLAKQWFGSLGGAVRVALAVLIGCLVVIGDVSIQCADRVRAAAAAGQREPLAIAIEDWEVATYLAVAVGLAAAAWVAAAAVPAGWRVGRLTRPVTRCGARGALIGGLGAMSGIGIAEVAAAAGPGEFWDRRYELESFWLIGSILGGLVGSGVGAGLGAAAYSSGQPDPAEDFERDNYRDKPDAEPLHDFPPT